MSASPRPEPRERPLISFVLVVHREQAYLEQCAASLLAEAGDTVEIVAIDDASPDHAPELLDALAERDVRVRVHHLAERTGLGAARNRALELVRGEYVWFVETTDVLEPDALGTVAAVLREHAPDLCLVTHARAHVLGGRTRPHRRALARAAQRGPGPLEKSPGLADLAPNAWDKVFRLELLERLDLRFGARGHAELSVTVPALVGAERIAAVEQVAYVRRRPPNALHDAFVGGTPDDALERYDAAFSAIAGLQPPAARRRLALAAALRHQLALLETVPADEQRAFFARISELLARHRRAGEAIATGRIGRARERLVARDGYAGFRLLERAVDARRARARRRADAARERSERERAEEVERHYRARRREPVDERLAVYAAYWYRGYSCNPRAIYEKARELAPDIRGVWVVRPQSVASMPDGVEYVVAGTPEYYDVLARARYQINNVGFPNEFVKREGTVNVMTHHGTPLKHMGLDLADTHVSRMRLDFEKLIERCRRWDFSISSNPHSTLVWERVYPAPYDSLETGYPRNDVLVLAGDDDVRRVRSELGVRPDQRAVLYAPTHREYRRDYVPTLDVAGVAESLGDDHVLLARLHYFYKADPVVQELHRAGKLIDVSGHPSIEELSLAADVLVTDYSSLMFDYAVLDRPIVIHAPDWDLYRATRGTYFDLMAEPPGTVVRSERALVDALRSGAESGADATRARAAFRERFCALEDGRASERVVRRVLLGETETVTAPALAAA